MAQKIEFSSHSQTKIANSIIINEHTEFKETQRLRFKDQNRFYSLSDHPSKLKSKYETQRNMCCKIIISIIEYIRWKINLLLLFRPFWCLSYSSCIPTFIYRITLGEIAFYIFFLYPILYDQLCKPVGTTTGHMATYWLTATYILAMRNNLLFSILFGLSFERVVMYHRIVARLATILALFHFYHCRSKSPWFGKEYATYAGSIALICNLLIIITSIGIFRRKTFEIFYKLHWLLCIVMTVFLYIHHATFIIYGVIVFGVDVMFRIYYVCFQIVEIKEMKLFSGNVIRIEFNKNCRFKYEAGQYVFICIPAIGLTEFHPFSISSSPFKNECIMIHIRVLGDWTKRLQKLVARYQEIGYDWSKLTCFIEGPYGQLQVPLHNYSSIVMVSGGIGITPLQSIFNELINNIRLNKVCTQNLKRIHFVWTVRDASMINEFEERHWSGVKYGDYHDIKKEQVSISLPQYFTPNLFIVKEEKNKIHQAEIITHFHMTGVSDDDSKQQYLKEFPFLKFGRPDVDDILREASSEYLSCGCITKTSGVAVLCCGPNGLRKTVKQHATKYGVACHAEIFEF